MKKILFIVQNLSVPEDRRVWMEAETLKKKGYSVTVISPGKNNQKKKETFQGIQIYRYLNRSFSRSRRGYLMEYLSAFLKISYLVWKAFLQKGFQVIQIANPPDFLFLIALPFKFWGVKLVYDQHDLMPEMFLAKFNQSKRSWLYRTLILLERFSLKFSDLYITTCEAGLKITSHRNSLQCPAFIVRTAPNLDLLSKNNIDKNLNQKIKQGIKKRFKYLAVYLGVMGPQDGVDKLLKSVRYLVYKLKRKNLGIILIGEGDDYLRLRKLVQTYKIGNFVSFVGWKDYPAINAYFKNADLGLMPEPKNSYTDNSLHNKVLEYMAFGLPIISYDLAGVRENAKGSAIYVKDNCEKRYARTIDLLLRKKDLRKKMSACGKRRILKKDFLWENSAENLKKAYQYLLDNKKKRLGLAIKGVKNLQFKGNNLSVKIGR